MNSRQVAFAIGWVIFSSIFTSCKIGRFVYYNFADINDYKIFPYREIVTDSASFQFIRPTVETFPQTLTIEDEDVALEAYLEANHTVAFLVIQNDSIKYERYFDNYSNHSIVPSFSMSKSITSILIGQAIDDGYIKSVNEPVTRYIPELSKHGFDNVKISHLLQMTSGIKFNENYFNPFGEVASFYYGTNLRKEIKKLKLKNNPGEKFEYTSGSTAILGLLLERALPSHNVSKYLEYKLWQPLAMEYDATWSVDRKKNSLEKAFCCINARAIDYAKIGRLYLHQGNWNGTQVVPVDWVETSTQIDTTEGSVSYYQYQWWLPNKKGDFIAQGILGQFIYVNPSKNLIIVRLGKKSGKVRWWKLFENISARY